MTQAEFNRDEILAALESAHSAAKLSSAAAENIRIWLMQPQFSEYVPQIVEHVRAGKWRELDDAFWTIIPFGTAGRRGRMYPIGNNTINDRTIGESAQGLADYVWSVATKTTPSTTDHRPLTTDHRCAIAYDTRHRSQHFAELCAEIMAGNGFSVLMFAGFRATPELSFTVRDQRCDCGTMISASHNPPADNAIKVFWSNGAQLSPPHDEGVIQCVRQVTAIKRVAFADALARGQIRFCQQQQDPRYQAAVLAVGNRSNAAPLRILYSPLHGVGLTSVLPILAADGFDQVDVYEPHAAPDGNFPNVPANVANPENPAVFDDLIRFAESSGAELILASDPDADRIGCAAPLTTGKAERGVQGSGTRSQESGVSLAGWPTASGELPSDQESGASVHGSDWRTLSGNQIGVLLADFLLRRLKTADELTPDHYLVKTLVTSDMVCRVAEQFGVRCYGDVLTGFKWIGGKIDEIGPEKFVFGFEEAHGYLAGTYTRDKDGAVAAMLLAELAVQCKLAGKTLHEELDRLFVEYGCHLERTISHTMPGADGLAQMKRVMDQLRSTPPSKLGGLVVQRVQDYLLPEITKVPASDLLIFDLLPAGNRAAVRPSGTEPKLKFYLFAAERPVPASELPAIKLRLAKRLNALEADLLAAAN
jgi:phosphoglucomutase/phosphomannomutase